MSQLHHPDQRMADTVCSPDPQGGLGCTRVPFQPAFPDKTIHLYAMIKGFQFDIGMVIERGLNESTHGCCTGALIHPSLIIELCRSAKVLMLDSEEQAQQRLPIPLPRVKFGSPDESNGETDDDLPAATPSPNDLVDSDHEVPSSSTQSLANQIHALTTRFDAYWDES